MLKRLFTCFIVLVSIFIFLPKTAFAQKSSTPVPSSGTPEATVSAELEQPSDVSVPQEEYSQAKVMQIVEDKNIDVGGYQQPYQKVKLKLLTGTEKDKEIEVEHGSLFAIQEDQKVKVGETVVITKTQGPTGSIYYITDKYRILPIIVLFGIFIALVLLFARLKGLSSLAGLIISILILIKYVVPRIIAGGNPLNISLAAALAIAILSIYMAHGLSRRTTLAIISTVITLFIAAGLSLLFVKFVNLSGTGSEEAIFLRMTQLGGIDLKGLLLGGIIIGTLGILDDITVSQTVIIDELRKANPRLSNMQLFSRGLSIGRDHIASLVNTLALAYAGAALPILLLFSISSQVPFWLTLNSEFIVEEIVRTLVGSMSLIMAVPISTFLAAYFLQKKATRLAVAEVTKRKTKSTTSRRKTTR